MKIRKIMIAVLAVVCVVSGTMTVSTVVRKQQDEEFYDSLRQAEETTVEVPAPEPIPEPAEEPVAETEPESMPEPEETSQATETEYVMPAKLDALRDNPSVIGWLEIADTKVDYPIAQDKEDNEFFLHRDINGEKNTVGSIYMDSNHDISEYGLHVVYGHHMRNGSMFKDVSKYVDEQYLKDHSDITVWTREREINLKPVCCYAGTADGDYRSAISSDEDLKEFFAEKTGKEISGNIFVFITCSYGSNNERTYLICEEKE